MSAPTRQVWIVYDGTDEDTREVLNVSTSLRAAERSCRHEDAMSMTTGRADARGDVTCEIIVWERAADS